MNREFSLFIGTFTTLLAIINPFEVLPVYLKLLLGKDVETHRRVAWKSCVYALLLRADPRGEQRVGLVNRRSMMRIIARRINAAADRA